MKDAKSKSNADGIDSAMLSVDNVGKNQNCSVLGKMTAAEDTKEDGCLVFFDEGGHLHVSVGDMAKGNRSSARVSIDFGEKNNLIQVIDVSEDGLAGERNRRSQAIPELCNQDLRPGDIIEIVNQRTDHGEIQQGLWSALEHPREDRS